MRRDPNVRVQRGVEDETGLVEVVVFPNAFLRRGQGFTVGELSPPKVSRIFITGW